MREGRSYDRDNKEPGHGKGKFQLGLAARRSFIGRPRLCAAFSPHSRPISVSTVALIRLHWKQHCDISLSAPTGSVLNVSCRIVGAEDSPK